MIQFLRNCLWSSLVLMVCAPAAFAAYQVEVVVFAPAVPDADGEQWVQDAGLPQPDGYALLGGLGDDGGPAVTPLPASSQRLGGVVATLRRGGRYVPLYHATWMNPEGGRNRGVFVQQAGPDGMPQVQGAVRIRVSRFLHADVDMGFVPAATAGAAPVPVRLQESRKIRLNELHYFDHPLFGVLVQVSRIGPAAEDEAGTEPADDAAADAAPAQ